MKKNFFIIRRLWDLLKPFHKHFYVQVSFIIILQSSGVGFTWMMSKLLDATISKNVNLILKFFIPYLILLVIYHFVDWAKKIHEQKTTARYVQQFLQEYSLQKVLELNISQHLDDHSALKQTVVTKGEKAVEKYITSILYEILPTFVLMVVSVVTISLYSLSLGLFSLIILIILFLWSYRFSSYHKSYVKDLDDTWVIQSKTRVEAFEHLQLVKVLAKEKTFISKYANSRLEAVMQSIKVWKMSINHNLKKNIFTEIGEMSAIAITIIYYFIGKLSVGNIYLIFMLNGRIYWQISALTKALKDIPLSFVEIEKYFQLIDKKPSFSEDGKKKFVGGDIVFENLNFKYPHGDSEVIKNFNLRIPHGQKVAFVGHSGSGKTTITKLVLRMYDWGDGDITIAGQSLRKISAKSLRENVGYVEQHVDLFDASIRDNIAFGVKDEKGVTDKILEQVARKARIDQFYHRLGEKKFDTIIGERGIKLSGGERQRVGIARALIKNPDILIFDEATSALDSENEKYIKEAIDEASEGRTTIIIAHRLSTIFDADKIIVMDRGQIVGEGTHDELMQSCDVYKDLVTHQELV